MRTGSRNKAKVAIANRIARALFIMLSNPSIKWRDIGPQRANTEEQQIRDLVRKLEKRGVKVDYHVKKKLVSAEREQVVKI